MILIEETLMRLKKLRLDFNMTQADLAKKLGVSNQTLLNWENGIYEPKIAQLIKLADIFGVTIDYLVERKSINEVDNLCQKIEEIPKEHFIEFLKEELNK